MRREAATGTRNVLVLAYDFPPCPAPGAAIRTAKFVRYLPAFGWQATVVCRGEPAAREENVVAIPAGVPEGVSYQAAAWTWAHRIESRVRTLLAAQPFDVVYASGPPFPHLLTAARAAGQAGLPLVADFRDGWSLDPYVAGPLAKRLVKRGLLRWIYPRLEQRVLSASAAVVTNTPSMTAALRTRLAPGGAKLVMVPNGFDDADFASPTPTVRPRRDVELLYCGRFEGIAGRSAEPLLRGLRIVVDSGRRLTLRILGDDGASLRRLVGRLGLDEVVRLEAAVPHAEAVAEMRRADVLVLYQAASPSLVTPIAGKTFEYLRCGRPLLAVVPPGDNATLVSQYAHHHRLVTAAEPHCIARALSELADLLPVATHEPGTEFMQFNRRALTGRLAGVFGDVAPCAVAEARTGT